MSKFVKHAEKVKRDRLTEYSRDRLETMTRRISESRDPDVIASTLRYELKNLVHDYDLKERSHATSI